MFPLSSSSLLVARSLAFKKASGSHSWPKRRTFLSSTRSSRVKSIKTYGCSSGTASQNSSAIDADWTTGRLKNRWTYFANAQEGCLSTRWPRLSSSVKGTTVQRSSLIVSCSRRGAVYSKGGPSSRLMQHSTRFTLQSSRRPSATTTQRMIPEFGLFSAP